ncbi:MAG TPA: metallophosphoesterase [Candidatus Sulfomarinibacteraceae bacterium]|nr:metallophosphoesterase [Candidatus Sulfomarinibacteraceae bacterium]
MIRRHPAILVAVALTVALCATSSAEAGRIVAVGDVHGELDGFVAILQEAKLIDDQLHWIGGDATLIQMGDVFDRGLEVRGVLDLLMRLQKEARRAGGRVEMILGNHEAMNLTGFFRDVHPEVFSTFADARSKHRRSQLWSHVERYRRVRDLSVDDEVREAWMAAHPLGWIEYVEAIGRKGHYGKWLRERPLAVLIDGVLFIHGGIGPEIAGQSVEALNETLLRELEALDRTRTYLVTVGVLPETAGLAEIGMAVQVILKEADKPDSTDLIRRHAAMVRGIADIESWLLLSPEGPLWFRGAAGWDEAERSAEMAALLDGIGAERMVVGHTPDSDGRIRVRFGGRVVLIDTGILSSYYEGGRPSALEIDDGAFTAVYLDGRERLPVAEELDRAAMLVVPAVGAEPVAASAR